MKPSSKKWVCFLDEAGNTGANFTDETQRYFVLAGMSFEESDISKARNIVLDWEKKVSRPAQTEIKSSSLIKTRHGRSLALDLMDTLANNGACPTYCLVEKSFAIVAHLIEALLDPLYNARFREYPPSGKDAKYDFADELHTAAPIELINEFWKGVMQSNRGKISEYIEEILQTARKAGLSSFLEYAASCPIDRAVDDLTSKPSRAINITATLTLLSKNESFFRVISPDNWSIKHDANSFQKEMAQVSEKITGGGFAEFLRDEFGSPIEVGDYLYSGIEFIDSTNEPLVRAADLFAGLLKYLLEKGDEVSEFNSEDAQSKLGLILAPVLQILHPNLGFPPNFHFMLSAKRIVDLIKLLPKK